MADKVGKKGGRPDIGSLGGILISVAGILGGLILEGGKIADVSQITAGIIVLGGTLGAVMLTSPLSVLIKAIRKLTAVFFEESQDPSHVIEEIITYATRARKNGIVYWLLPNQKFMPLFVATVVHYLRDRPDWLLLMKCTHEGLVGYALKRVLGARCALVAYGAEILEQRGNAIVRAVFRSADRILVDSAYAKGLVVGHGIAVAFVATVYGVAFANLFCLPAANKLKSRAHQALKTKEMMLEGIISIVEGMNPKLIRMKLEAYEEQTAGKKVRKESAEVSSTPRTASAEG